MSDEKVILVAEFDLGFHKCTQETMALAGFTDVGKFLKNAIVLYRFASDAVRRREKITVESPYGEHVQEITGIIQNPVD